MNKEQRNQCDGCRRGLPIRNGIHIDDKLAPGNPLRFDMWCTRYRYVCVVCDKPLVNGICFNGMCPNCSEE